MRPKFAVIEYHPNLLHVVDINIFETEDEMKQYVDSIKNDIYLIGVYILRNDPEIPKYQLAYPYPEVED